MNLFTSLINFITRAFRNRAQATLILSLLYLSVRFCSTLNDITTYSSNLQSRLLTLRDLPTDYARSFNESLNKNLLFIYNTTNLPIRIPRIIHRTYKSTDIPLRWLSSQNSCKEQNPTYTHMLWTDESARQFIAEHFPWFIPTYDSYPYPIERVDSIRYFLLWHYGGIYIDLDVSCRRSLDPLLAFAAWFPKTDLYSVSNDIMASIPRHSIMLKLALSLQDHNGWFGTGYTTVFWATGPMFVNGILGKWFEVVGNVEGEDGVRILPPMFYDRTPYTFFEHREGNSWHGWDAAVVKWAYGRLWWILAAVALAPAVLMALSTMRRRGDRHLYLYRM
ncbi:nucleotide-diphospho-sugar transferase [Rhexocercosporidium sp. MPI-PUGE-AT-0058]|nr:nucleotide-diphospho-sugar transferase [Rhexocercosporidium sp. MPI-PUGE-AT-0058]